MIILQKKAVTGDSSEDSGDRILISGERRK